MQTKTMIYIGGGIAAAFAAFMLLRRPSAPANDSGAYAVSPSFYGQSPVSSGVVGGSTTSTGTDPLSALMAGDLAKANLNADTERMRITSDKEMTLSGYEKDISIANIGLKQATQTSLANALSGIIGSLGSPINGNGSGVWAGLGSYMYPNQGQIGNAAGSVYFDDKGGIVLDVTKRTQQGPQTLPYTPTGVIQKAA